MRARRTDWSKPAAPALTLPKGVRWGGYCNRPAKPAMEVALCAVEGQAKRYAQQQRADAAFYGITAPLARAGRY